MKTIVFACENGFGMSRGSFCTNSQLRALRKWRILMCFGIFNMFYMFSYVFSSKTIYFAHFEALGMLKTAPACIFHHIWYGWIKISIIVDHFWSHILIYGILCQPGQGLHPCAAEASAKAPGHRSRLYID